MHFSELRRLGRKVACDAVSRKMKGSRKSVSAMKAPSKDRVNGPSTTTRNQINEKSLADENFLGGSPVIYRGRLLVIRAANTTKVAGVLNGTA